MQKKIIISVILLVTTFSLIYFYETVQNNTKKSAPLPVPVTPITDLKNTIEIPAGEKNYRVSWFKVDNINSLSLIPNFSEKKPLSEIIELQKCKFAANGGFYTKEDTPTGLFITEGKLIKKWEKTNFLNGVFVVDKDNKAFIDEKDPGINVKIALETGPVVKRNSKMRKLSVANDKQARRVLVGVTAQGEIYFFVIYDPSSYYLGPLLVETPKMVQLIEDNLKITFTDVLNLDGGSASAFLEDTVYLTEAKTVGSLFCIK